MKRNISILITLNVINLLLIIVCGLYKCNLIFKSLDSYDLIISVLMLIAIIFEIYCFIFLVDIILGKKIYDQTLGNLIILCIIYSVLVVCFLVPMLMVFYDFIMLPLIILSPMIAICVMLFIKIFRKKFISRFNAYLYIFVPLMYIFTISLCVTYVYSFGGIA